MLCTAVIKDLLAHFEESCDSCGRLAIAELVSSNGLATGITVVLFASFRVVFKCISVSRLRLRINVDLYPNMLAPACSNHDSQGPVYSHA
jgi:hypothetical protein